MISTLLFFFRFYFVHCVPHTLGLDQPDLVTCTTPNLIHLVSRCRNLSPCGIIYCSCSLRVNQNDSQVRVSGTARVAATLLTSNQQRARPIFTASPLHPFNSPLDKGNFQVSLIIHVRYRVYIFGLALQWPQTSISFLHFAWLVEFAIFFGIAFVFF